MQPAQSTQSTQPTQPALSNWTAVVAIARGGVIGRDQELPWRLSTDLQRFKRLTMNHCLLMGRKTFQSIGKPLPGRQTIVLSRSDFEPNFPEVLVVHDPALVASKVELGRKIMVVGGAEIYRATIDQCSTIWLTRVLADVEGNVFFPDIDWNQWKLVECEEIPSGPRDQFATQFETWQRK